MARLSVLYGDVVGKEALQDCVQALTERLHVQPRFGTKDEFGYLPCVDVNVVAHQPGGSPSA